MGAFFCYYNGTLSELFFKERENVLYKTSDATSMKILIFCPDAESGSNKCI